MRIVVALGGNALLERGESPDADIQEKHVRAAAEALGPLAREHELILTHGNGPQVGLLAMENENDRTLSRPYPFDVLGAQTQGMIGYWLIQALRNQAQVSAACVISRTRVRADDPALTEPTKFVGAVYEESTARTLATQCGWRIGRDGQYWRRVVPSPEPVEIIELPLIAQLLDAGATVVCAGGGGIPVVATEGGELHGVEAVIDKDLTSALLAKQVGADVLLLLTDVDGVQDGFGTSNARRISKITSAALGTRQFSAGSMGPKVTAARRFVDAGGRFAAIGRLEHAGRLINGDTGTIVQPSAREE